jgi:hypothetical protein
MELINHTSFPALAFQATDQHGQSSHVVVMRATFDIQVDGTLAISGKQEPIALTDEYFGEINKSSIKQESDLAPFKPRCDVIVNATAYAPGGNPSLGFVVSVRINGPPQENGDTGPLIMEKKLLITGPRFWEKGLMGRWTLKPPNTPVTSLPLRYEYAFGGDCRIDGDDPAAKRVDSKYLLTPEQCKQHPDGPDNAPAAHTACDTNPLGIGFVEPWYLKATGLKKIPAPQIDSNKNPVLEFGKTYHPQGFGVITRAWQPRLKLAGTYDDNWFKERLPGLPDDFDFAYWNCACPDMQIQYLNGDETIELTNLTPEGKLMFHLPGHTPHMLVHHVRGDIATAPAHLDTLIIEPDQMRATLVWRATIPVEPEVRVLESHLTLKEDTDELSTTVRETING